MASFYGGKQGITYNIVARYDSVADMVSAFSQGGTYTTVNYGEYVIIDTNSKNDPQNGLLYRRGFQYSVPYNQNDVTDPGGGAIYVGQIVGPQGGNTEVHVKDWGTGQGSGIPTTASAEVPGIVIEDGAAAFNDKILLRATNEKDSSDVVRSTDLQFQIPYPVIRLSASAVDLTGGPATITHDFYDNNGTSTSVDWQASNNTIIHKANSQHPFYLDYQIAVPKGEKGDQGDGIVSMGLQGDNIYVVYSDNTKNTDSVYPYGTSPTIAAKIIGHTGSAYHIAGTCTTADLVTTYANGLGGFGNFVGYTILVEDQDNSTVYIYAYDYLDPTGGLDGTGWKQVYDLGKIDISGKSIAVISQNDAIPSSLAIGGIAFVNYGNQPAADA